VAFDDDALVALLGGLSGARPSKPGAWRVSRLYLAVEDIDHSRTKTKSPQTNGNCERFHKTVLPKKPHQVTYNNGSAVYNTIPGYDRDGGVVGIPNSDQSSTQWQRYRRVLLRHHRVVLNC
jgi:transposase InsO family protein